MQMSPEWIKNGLAQFSGSEDYHLLSLLHQHLPSMWDGKRLFGRLLCTDGVKWLAETAQAYWLIDAIASWQSRIAKECKKNRDLEGLQVWRLKRTDAGGAVLTCDDGNVKLAVEQKIEYTDFPLDEIKLYVEPRGDGTLILLLPSEH